MVAAEQIRKGISSVKKYISDEADRYSSSEAELFLEVLLPLVGLEVVGAAYATDLILHGDKNFLYQETKYFPRGDTPNDVKATLTYTPLGFGIVTGAILTRHSYHSFKENAFDQEKIEELGKFGAARRAFLKLVFYDTARNAAWSLVSTGFGFFMEPTVIGAAVDEHYLDQRLQKEQFTTNLRNIQKLVEETVNNRNSHVSLDNYTDQAREIILDYTAVAREAFASDDPTRRLNAKHIFAWMCLNTTGDRTIYEAYFKDKLPLDPSEYPQLSPDDQRKVDLFVESFDMVTSVLEVKTRFKEETYPNSVLSNAMIEAAFRTMALVINPNLDNWKVDDFTITAQTLTNSGVINRTTTGAPKYTSFQEGDTPSYEDRSFVLHLDPHVGENY